MSLISMTAANITQWVAFGQVKVSRMFGFNNQGATVYIQLHQIPPLAPGASGGLTASTVPAVKSFACPTAAAFNFSFSPDGLELSELYVGLSSTEVNYTAVAANAGLDLTLDVGSNYLCNGNEVVVGDQSTNQQTLQVWSEATGLLSRLRLLRADIRNTDTTHAAYCNVYATDAMAGTDLIVARTPIALGGASPVVTPTNYGINGVSPFQQDANYTQHFGCSIKVTGSTNCNIRAIYR